MIPPHDIAQELTREMAARRATYPRMVERMRMTAEQMATEFALCSAWQADCARYGTWLASATPRAPIAPVALSGGFSWAQRRSGLQRELDQRARLYPGWIAKGQLDPAAAAQRMARLAAMADLYDEGWDWHDTFGNRPPFGARMTAQDHTPAEAEAIRQWWHHAHRAIATRYGAPVQEQLAL